MTPLGFKERRGGRKVLRRRSTNNQPLNVWYQTEAVCTAEKNEEIDINMNLQNTL